MFHTRPCKDTRQWPAQPIHVRRSMSICMAKEECRQELVPAFGHGTDTWRMTEIVDKKNIWRWRGHNPLQIAVGPCFRRRPHGISWPFSNCPMFIKHCDGFKIHRTLLLKIFISSGASSPRVSQFIPCDIPMSENISRYLSICKLENEAILQNFLEIWKFSARLPNLTLTSSKTKQFCEPSSIFEVDSIKKEAILRDFFQKWKAEC